jgi:hypothetical protein
MRYNPPQGTSDNDRDPKNAIRGMGALKWHCYHSYLPCNNTKHINVNAVNVNITMGFVNLNETKRISSTKTTPALHTIIPK